MKWNLSDICEAAVVIEWIDVGWELRAVAVAEDRVGLECDPAQVSCAVLIPAGGGVDPIVYLGHCQLRGGDLVLAVGCLGQARVNLEINVGQRPG